jgi:hypothetical protein
LKSLDDLMNQILNNNKPLKQTKKRLLKSWQ